MESPQEDKDENAIRHYKGTIKQFKDMFDDLAGGKDTNAYNSPVRQGFDVHPTRDPGVISPHWEESHEDEKTQNENHVSKFNIFESKKSEALAKALDKAMIKIDDSMSYEDFALAVGQILRDEYGQHNFKRFMQVLHKDLGM
jgi:3-methyladenine DNA glycosylase Tag